jgi:hypothetical protein
MPTLGAFDFDGLGVVFGAHTRKNGILFCSYDMAKPKCEPLLDWRGKPIAGVWRHRGKKTGFKTYTDEQGKEYWINDGERDYDLPFLKVSERNENGIYETVFDSRYSPPPPAKV